MEHILNPKKKEKKEEQEEKKKITPIKRSKTQRRILQKPSVEQFDEIAEVLLKNESRDMSKATTLAKTTDERPSIVSQTARNTLFEFHTFYRNKSEDEHQEEKEQFLE